MFGVENVEGVWESVIYVMSLNIHHTHAGFFFCIAV